MVARSNRSMVAGTLCQVVEFIRLVSPSAGPGQAPVFHSDCRSAKYVSIHRDHTAASARVHAPAGGATARTEPNKERHEMLIGRMVLDRVRRALAIMQEILERASRDLLMHPVGEGRDPGQRRTVSRMRAVIELPQVMRGGARADHEDVLLFQRGERAANRKV